MVVILLLVTFSNKHTTRSVHLKSAGTNSGWQVSTLYFVCLFVYYKYGYIVPVSSYYCGEGVTSECYIIPSRDRSVPQLVT